MKIRSENEQIPHQMRYAYMVESGEKFEQFFHPGNGFQNHGKYGIEIFYYNWDN